ncbi:unnamed protein product, partial [Mesorhabditis spiculigera]
MAQRYSPKRVEDALELRRPEKTGCLQGRKFFQVLLSAHAVSHAAHAVAALLLFLSWKAISIECSQVVQFIAKLHVILAAIYTMIATGKLATLLASYFGQAASVRMMSVICALLSAKIYVMAMLAEAVLELATFAHVCKFSDEIYKHLWLSRIFFGVSLMINGIFLAVSLYYHPDTENKGH